MNGLPASVPASRIPHEKFLCAVVALTGLIEASSGLADLVIIGDIANNPDLSLGGLAKLAPMVVHLLLGLTALGFSIGGRLRLGVAALAIWALARWAGDLPSLIHSAVGGAEIGILPFKMIGQPLLGAGALAAAWRNGFLAPATAAVALMTLIDVGDMVWFAVAVSLYGI